MKIVRTFFAVALFAMLAVVCVGQNCYAGSATVQVIVTDAYLKPLAGAKVVFRFPDGLKTVYTNAMGQAAFPWHNWCDTPVVVCSKTGYFTQSRQVGDGSCWGCTPGCPPAYAEGGCAKTITVRFKLIKNVLVTSLADRPEVATVENRNQIIQTLLGIWVATYCNRQATGCDYDCLYQGVVDFFNGNENMFGHQTRPDISLPDCPDVVTFVDFVNNWLDAMWEYYYGDNFPDEGTEE